MMKYNQTVKIEYGNGDSGTLLNQTVTNVVIDEEGYAFGLWNGKLVGAFSLKSFTWFVI